MDVRFTVGSRQHVILVFLSEDADIDTGALQLVGLTGGLTEQTQVLLHVKCHSITFRKCLHCFHIGGQCLGAILTDDQTYFLNQLFQRWEAALVLQGDVKVRLVALLSCYAVTGPVERILAFFVVELTEPRLDDLTLGVAYASRSDSQQCQFCVGLPHCLLRKVVALQLMRTEHRAGQFLHMAFCIAQCFFDEVGGLCLAYCPADGVFRGCVQNDFQRQTVVVGRATVLALLLIGKLSIPAVKDPHEHCRGRSLTLHGVAHFVPECLCTLLAGHRDEAVVGRPLLNGAPGDCLPSVSGRPLVVEVGYLLAVEVPVFADESDEHVCLFALEYLRRVLVAVSVVLMHETFQTILLILTDLRAKFAVVLRKTEGIVQFVQSADILGDVFP